MRRVYQAGPTLASAADNPIVRQAAVKTLKPHPVLEYESS